MHRGNSGQIRVLEALLATAIIFSALLLTHPIYVALAVGGDSEALYSAGMNALMVMNREGQLGQLIAQNNWTGLSKQLSTLLPIGVSYNLTVYDEAMQVVNHSLIANGDAAGKNVVAVQYVLVERTDCRFYVVRLQVGYMK
jgi:hypothetical protein